MHYIIPEVMLVEFNKEVLKGHIDTIILALLSEIDLYGYEIAKLVKEKSSQQFELKEGTLYLSLKRLEKNEYIDSYWSEEQGAGGRRKYYTLTDKGSDYYKEKTKEWQQLKTMMDTFLKGEL